MRNGILFFVIYVLALPTCLLAQSENPVELGAVNWLRNLDDAKLASAKSAKPILLLFQEIPGCETCQTFGNRPLSHPLLVEAIEDLFVPVAIYNNKKGYDETILTAFKEPSWNNPVIRYLDSDGNDIIERKDRVWSVAETAQRMIAAQMAFGVKSPGYLKLVAEESTTQPQTATFAMHCYWEGEGQLGSIPGVLDTRSAWVGKNEVVDVKFDPARVDYKTLLDKALKLKCASTIYPRNDDQAAVANDKHSRRTRPFADAGEYRDAKLSDQKYYLRNTPLVHLPLTPLQATRLNSTLLKNRDSLDDTIHSILSPRQRKLWSRIQDAVSQNKEALEGFEAPASVFGLAEYQTKLEAELAKQ